ncbi:MAG: hypothetical protein WCK89_15015 [bacterium]
MLSKIKQRLGSLWWYTLIMFCVQRFGDVINMFVGLWLVPQYVSPSELGAVLPLVQMGNILGLPLMIVMGPFVKFLNTHATHGEYGKVKALLRDGCLFTLLLFLATMLYARFVLPPVFERMRVAEGSLGLLIVLSGVVAVAAPIATTALQGLKKFRIVILVGILGAPLRLATMAVCLPIRGLSGYFVGQTLPNLLTMCIAFFGLRHILGRAVKAEPYWRSDGKRMLAYMGPCGIVIVLGVMQMAVEAFVIRHRLPDLESAAYYMISRFAEMGAYMGMTMIFVAFPLIAERHEKGETSGRLLWHSMGGTLAVGLSLALLFFLFGAWLFRQVDAWHPYAAFAPQMSVLTMMYAFRLATGCFTSHEMACRRFTFLSYYGVLLVVEMLVLYGLTGYRFFSAFIPGAWMTTIEALNPCCLSFVLGVMFMFTLLAFGASLAHALRQARLSHRRQ